MNKKTLLRIEKITRKIDAYYESGKDKFYIDPSDIWFLMSIIQNQQKTIIKIKREKNRIASILEENIARIMTKPKKMKKVNGVWMKDL